MRLTALREIALVIFFRAPEFRSRLDLRHDRARKASAPVDFFFRGFRHRFLFGRMIKNRRTILRADIRPLSIQRRWIMVRPEDIEQLFVTNLCRIEFDFDHFGVTGLVAANIFVARIVFCSAGVANRCCCYAFEISKDFFHAPKTARAERCFLCRHVCMMKRE
jgi:hypothetical protein